MMVNEEFPNKNTILNSLGRIIRKVRLVPVYLQSAVRIINPENKIYLYAYQGNREGSSNLQSDEPSYYSVKFANGDSVGFYHTTPDQYSVTLVCFIFKSSKLYFWVDLAFRKSYNYKINSKLKYLI